MNKREFYNELKRSLPSSSSNDRKVWASTIIENNLNIRELSKLLWCDQKIASRFSWLLSEIGHLEPTMLYSELPFLFELSDKLEHINFKDSFASFWLICGIPLENEASGIDLLFSWLLSPKINVTTKSRSILVLLDLSEKYPELKNELKLCIEDQIDKYTDDFAKRSSKILMNL